MKKENEIITGVVFLVGIIAIYEFFDGIIAFMFGMDLIELFFLLFFAIGLVFTISSILSKLIKNLIDKIKN